MRSILSLGAALLLLGSTTKGQSFLSNNDLRSLQTQGTTYTSQCTSDSTCGANFCCADYKKATASLLKTCVPTQLHNKIVTYNGASYSWVCISTSRPTAYAATQTACDNNAACGTSNCCLNKAFNVLGVDQALGNFCGEASTSGVKTFQDYNVVKSANSFTTTVSFTQTCLVDPTPPTPPPAPTPVEPQAPAESTTAATPAPADSPAPAETPAPVAPAETPAPATPAEAPMTPSETPVPDTSTKSSSFALTIQAVQIPLIVGLLALVLLLQ
jgi:hypothetical protein